MATDVYHGDRKAAWFTQAFEISDQVNWNVKYAFYEQPFYIPGAAGNQSQAVTKLMTTAGIIAGTLNSRGVMVYPVDVSDWKGQVKKEITHARVKKRLPDWEWGPGGHDVDAVGIGLWVLGRLG